jgi:hypothetical protein
LVERMVTKKIEFRIAGRDAEYVGIDEETGGKKYRARDADIRIDKNAVIVKGFREVRKDIFEWRLETTDGKNFVLRADKLGDIIGNEKRHKALMVAPLKKQGGSILIQAMNVEDVRCFKEYVRRFKGHVEVDSRGWAAVEQALKAAEIAKGNELELCKCNFTRDRLRNIETFGVELKCASEFAEDMEGLIRQLSRRDKPEEALRGRALE